jgi:glycine/D-amino acid oxidase-like deaminating enzyme
MSSLKNDGSPTELPRRDFLRLAGIGAGAVLATPGVVGAASAVHPLAADAPRHRAGQRSGSVIVVGAGAWGAFTALELARRGAAVTLIDQYGPANSRSTSGDETRGIRSSYGDRAASGELWTAWARESIARWRAFDAEHAPRFGARFFIETGDVIFREKEEPFVTRSTEHWDKLGVRYERVSPDDARRRWPMINSEGYSNIVYEPDAGVARARDSIQATVALARDAGVTLRIGRVKPGAMRGGAMDGVTLDDGTLLRADSYVFACGPWLRKVFPAELGNRMRTPLGHVCYFGTPEGDERFAAPNIPSWNVPGVTGWGALPFDSRGFRVRGAFAPPPPPRAADEEEDELPPPPPRPQDPRLQDPDLSVRWSNEDRIAGSRRVLARVFPALAEAPIIETRACHYESSSNRNFIVDRLPGASNVWVTGAGQAEGFKFSPLIGEYAAKRVLGATTDPALAEAFKFPTEEYEAPRTGEDE